MTGLWVFLLAAGTAGIMLHGGRPHRPDRLPAGFVRLHRHRRADAELAWQLPVIVRQLAALLRAGRTPAAMWQDIARVHDLKTFGRPGPAGTLDPAGTDAGDRPGQDASGGRGGAAAALAAVLAPRIAAAGRAAELGLSVADTLRQDNGEAADPRFDRAWTELAACWEASELTGAPLAVLLENYADHLQQELDAAAARRTALAGPRATSVLLTWLPLLGLGLGMLMGVDPLGMLLGTPAGWTVLAAGAGLLVMGRAWSRRLVARAAGGQDAWW
ncbi:type II secretion system F family protein [Arthrobacter sp. GCM10027362]|uniref:type II secretion system F family protein n=1 Tax=Arthrobacter sp. GCM10027362 TaxID=3273379 RepID=UPI003626D38B